MDADVVVPSLLLDIEPCEEGWTLTAPWLPEPLIGPDWEELYHEAIRRRKT